MDPMLEAFLQESRDNLEAVGRCFLELEKNADDQELMNDLFRNIHTIKGSSGLFDIAPLTRVVHAAEDVLDVVREGELKLTPEHIDLFLDAMDQVEAWLDNLENTGELANEAEGIGQVLAEKLRLLLGEPEEHTDSNESASVEGDTTEFSLNEAPDWFQDVPDMVRLSCFADQSEDKDLFAIVYTPAEQCFFNGDDPIHTVQGLNGLRWFNIAKKGEWDDLMTLDPFHCNLVIKMVVSGKESEIRNYFKYVSEQVSIIQLQATQFIFPVGEFGDGIAYEPLIKDTTTALENDDFVVLKKSIRPLLEIGSADLIQTSALAWILQLLKQENQSKDWLKALIDSIQTGKFYVPSIAPNDTLATDNANQDEDSDVHEQAKTSVTSIATSKKHVASTDIPEAMLKLFATQSRILGMPCPPLMLNGRIKSTVKLLAKLYKQLGWDSLLTGLDEAGNSSIEASSCEPLANYLQQCMTDELAEPEPIAKKVEETPKVTKKETSDRAAKAKEVVLHNRRASDQQSVEADVATKQQTKTLRVDQERIDTLMDLVGELVVAKNSLPFLARRAEEEFQVKQLGKEIKSQYAIINRLAEELQSAMMSVRMVPVSSVFQRFPRLVRDLSRRLGKNIELVMEGEETEADKNVIESLADPLIHLVRNSLDHGIEMPTDRIAAGKPEKGTLILRATPMDDQVIIEIIDDGKGIDPNVIKQKAYEKGIIDEEKLESISDQEAIELIFAAGLSSIEQASDLSGRGVGMDVVRTAVNDAGGIVSLKSELGKGSTLSLSLPLSMAVAQVMMIDVDNQTYGISMECIRETVRVPASSIERIKHNEAIVLRDKLIPLKRMRKLLNLSDVEEPLAEEAVLIVMVNGEEIGLIIDDFQEGIDVIQKPLEGVMSSYPIYAGATLLGDGRVLLILNLAEII